MRYKTCREIYNEISAIPTSYNGVRFRSKLEARWAEFFDLIETPWQYEPKTFTLPSAGIYTPDFRLGDKCWLEIKPAAWGWESEESVRTPTMRKMAELCHVTREDSIICFGMPGNEKFSNFFHYFYLEGDYPVEPETNDEPNYFGQWRRFPEAKQVFWGCPSRFVGGAKVFELTDPHAKRVLLGPHNEQIQEAADKVAAL